MAERVSWAVSHSPGVITTVDGRHSLGSMLTPGATAMGKRNGRLPKLGLDPFNVTATAGTPDAFVHVAPGHMWTMGTRSVAPYIQTLDAIKDINILSTPAHASLTRWDLVIAQQNDELHSDADNTWTVKQVVGTPAASPADPTVTGSPDYVLLARVIVGPAVTTITNGNITQLLTAFTVALGGVLPVLNQTERDAVTGVYDGAVVWRRDRDWFEVYDGAAWRIPHTAVCSNTGDRDAAITGLYNGQLAVTTDTGSLWLRYAGSWVRLSMGGTLFVQRGTDQSVTNSTVLVNDNVLVLPVEANALYRVDCYFIHVGPNDPAGGLKLAWTAPAGATMPWTGFGANQGTVTSYDTVVQQLSGGRVYATLTSPTLSMRPAGYLLTAGTAGNLQLQWAQGTANAVATTMKAGSLLQLTRVA